MEDLEKIVADIKAGMMTPDQVKSIVAELKLNDELKAELEAVKSAAEAIGMELKEMKTKGEEKAESVKDVLSKAWDQAIKAFEAGQKFNVSIKSNVLRSSIGSDTNAYRVPGVNQAAYAATRVASLFPRVTLPSNHHGMIKYVDQTTVTRNAAAKGEAAAYPESALAWTERTLAIEKLADSIPVSKEAMRDVDFVASEIERLLRTNLMLLENTQIYSGDGGAPDFTGVYTTATAFNAGAYSGTTIADATLYDLINVLKTEITNGKESKYMPNYVVLNPADVLRLTGTKDSNGQYVIPPFAGVTGDSISVMGLQVIADPVVTANTMLIGDFRQGTIYQADGIEVELGYINAQFTSDLMTLKASLRENLLIKTIDAGAFRKVTDITAAITAITTPAS